MKATTLAALALALLLLVCPLVAGDLSDFYTPYGFRLPALRQGEYSISGWAYWRDYEFAERYEDTLPRGLAGDYTHWSAVVRGALALTDEVLVEASFEYHPGQRDYHVRTWHYDTWADSLVNYERGEDSKRCLVPRFTLVFRPTPVVEFHATMSLYSRWVGMENRPPENYMTRGQRTDERNFLIGFTCQGGL